MKALDRSPTAEPTLKYRRTIEEIYADHAPRAFRLAYLLTGDRNVAADLVHEAFVRAFGKFTHLRSDEVVAAYLRRTLINRANSHFRRKKVERRFAESQRGEPFEASPIERVEQRQDLVAALRRLPMRQRAALTLRYLEELSEEETADALGTTAKAVNSLVNRGLNNLRHGGGDDVER